MHQNYVPDFQVRIEGTTLAADVSQAVMNLTFDSSLEMANMFSLQMNNADLRFTDSALFDVGKTVEIYMGYVGNLHPMMLGEITAVNPTFPQSGAPTIAISGYDKSHRMRRNDPERAAFRYMNDSAIAARIAAENLLIPVVDPSPMPPRECVIQTGSDWALLKELAERNFFHVYVHLDKLYFQLPRPQPEMRVLEWGRNLSSFTPRLSTSEQFGIQVIRAYDYKLAQQIVSILPAADLKSDLGDIIERLGSGFVEQLMRLGRNVIRDRPVRNYVEATFLAKSILMQLLQGLYEGTGNCIGMPELHAGDTVEIRGVGRRFSGKYTLSKVTHTINDSGYQTRFEVTQKNTSSLLQTLRKKIAESPSPNRQEKIYGLVVGKVVDNVDKEGYGRIQVSFPHLGDGNMCCWARIASPMAGGDPENSWGIYVLPDRGDEVLVSFSQGNIDEPVVVGSLWNGKAPPPERNTDGFNRVRLIKSRSGHTVTLDDTDGAEKLIVGDKAGSTIEFLPNGNLKLEAVRDLELRANGNINLDATNVNVKVSEAMDVS